VTVSEAKRLQIYNGYVTAIPQRPAGTVKVSVRVYNNGHLMAVAAGQSQRVYSGVGIFNWYYPSSTPRELRIWGAEL
jgi:hypothetical protein